jgi:hypothetical protein
MSWARDSFRLRELESRTVPNSIELSRRVVAEGVGTAILLATVVGSGIMGDRLAGGNLAIALLANTVATGAALVALILTFGPISGGHFNPAVTRLSSRVGSIEIAAATLGDTNRGGHVEEAEVVPPQVQTGACADFK